MDPRSTPEPRTGPTPGRPRGDQSLGFFSPRAGGCVRPGQPARYGRRRAARRRGGGAEVGRGGGSAAGLRLCRCRTRSRGGEAGPATLRPLSQGPARGTRWGTQRGTRYSGSGSGSAAAGRTGRVARRRRAAKRVLRTGHRSPYGGGPLDLRLPLPRPATGPTGGHAPAGSADEEDAYSIMAADEIRVLAAGPVAGEVLVRGRLVDRRGQLLAGFRANDPHHVGQPRDRSGNPARSPAPTRRRPLEFLLCRSICLGARCADPVSQPESGHRCQRRRATGSTALRRDPRRRPGARRSSPRACPIIAVAACGNSIHC